MKKKVKKIGGEKCAANEWKGKKKGSSININADTLTVTLVAY